jgi:hypothetical protein
MERSQSAFGAWMCRPSAAELCQFQQVNRCWLAPAPGRIAGRAGEAKRRGRTDLGGNKLSMAKSARPYLQGLMVPGSVRPLRDSTSRTDPDFYRLFDNQSPNTFQADGLLLSCELRNLSAAPISISLLNRQGQPIRGSRTAVAPGANFNYSNSLSKNTFYIKVFTGASGRNDYVLNLSIINS